jgi:hypothetical protein
MRNSRLDRAHGESLRTLHRVSDWLEDGIGQASERRDLPRLLRHARDRALLLLAFWRRIDVDELVSLQVELIDITPLAGLTCYLVNGEQRRLVNWRRLSTPALAHLCPVSALALWLSLSGLTGGPLFREITHNGDLSEQAMRSNSVAALLRNLRFLSGDGDD